MTTRGTFAALAIMLLLSIDALALEPHRDGQQTFISRAVFADGRLWLLTDSGELSSITEGSNRRVEEEALVDPVRDICLARGALVAFTCAREGCTTASLRMRKHGTWSVDATLPFSDEHLLALTCGGAGVSVLTTRRLVDLGQAGQSEVRLSESLDAGLVTVAHDGPAGFFVGFNAGEWGGGLRRIDRRTGTVSTIERIERDDPDDLCAGPLNTACDPVNGIVTSPWNSQCVVAAIGLVHFMAHGRIVEVCGTTVQTLYVKSLDESPTKTGHGGSSVAFFGLSRNGDALWAAGIDGVYDIKAKGIAVTRPMPEFKDVGGVYVNFDSPQMILVLTQINRRASISGSVPLMVLRH